MRYEVAADGTLSDGRVFFDMTSAPGEEALDGIKVDRAGQRVRSGPGGLWILSPDGKHLGTLRGAAAGRELRVGRRRREGALPDGSQWALQDAPLDRGSRPVRALALVLALVAAPFAARAQFAQESPALARRRLDARFDALIAPGTRAEQIVAGHVWLEGPSWDARKGALYFSDVVKNRLWRWTPGAHAWTRCSIPAARARPDSTPRRSRARMAPRCMRRGGF